MLGELVTASNARREGPILVPMPQRKIPPFWRHSCSFLARMRSTGSPASVLNLLQQNKSERSTYPLCNVGEASAGQHTARHRQTVRGIYW
jgi:hypothetical protein